jgi:hypothetical protein
MQLITKLKFNNLLAKINFYVNHFIIIYKFSIDVKKLYFFFIKQLKLILY